MSTEDQEHLLHPGRADAPPEPPQATGPFFAEETPEKQHPGGVRGFFRPAAKNPKGAKNHAGSKGGPKTPKPKTPSQIRRDREASKRRLKRGVRYGGSRRILPLIFAAGLVAVLLSLAAMFVAASKPTEADINTAVDERLNESGLNFPRGEAVMWAGQVLRVWGTWDEENPDAREVALAPYLSSGMDSQAGWNEQGSQEVIYASVNPEAEVTSENHANVEAVYQIGDGSWRCVSIPTYAYHPEDPNLAQEWAFALAGNPTPVPCAPRTGAPSVPGNAAPGQEDEGLRENEDLAQELAESFFPGFFSAWAASDTNSLAQFTASGVTLTGLGGAMASTPQPVIGDASIWVDQDGVVDGKTYYAYVPVSWTVSGSDTGLTAAYVVPVKSDNDRWAVAGEPRAAEQSTEVGGGSPAEIPQPEADVVPQEFDQGQPTPTGEAEESDPSDDEPSAEASSDASASPSPSASSEDDEGGE